ncbi:hypothetical protein [Mycoplasma hafezii]|uniref:hypothetical protein n=1 Tax=Mycoplasma hafezii TaxID=525886 RepID=UPI003CF61B6A
MKIEWEKIIKEKRLKNIQSVYDSIGSKWLHDKIIAESERTDIPIEKYYQEIRDLNLIVISKFAKDPSKQNIHEQIAGDFIKKIDGVTEFKILPKSGKYAKYLTSDGNVLEFQPAIKSLKTIDMQWKYNNCMFYASHKYTDQEGGAQDNQFEDIKKFLKSVQQRTDSNVFFIALTDGNYYQTKSKNGISRLELLNTAYKGFVSVATPTDELADIMKELCDKS